MANYFLTGVLGSGKTLCAVDKIRDYLSEGRPVATNLDIKIENMLLPESKKTITRIPDKPRVEDLQMLGYAYPQDEKYDENRFGLVVLDECATWLNSRNWNDKERKALIDYFLHIRKYRWDVYFLVQDIEAVDGQLRKALCEHLVICKRWDRMRILKLKPPRVHQAHIYYGQSTTGPYVGRWTYRGDDLLEAYDTGQVFTDDQEFMGDELVDMRATYTILSPWHLKGRYDQEEQPSMKHRYQAFVKKVLLYTMAIIAYGHSRLTGMPVMKSAVVLGLAYPRNRPRLIGFEKASPEETIVPDWK